MKDITYKIVFHSEWQCGSGLSAGADVDLLPIKDKNELPFVPGKTMKGLIREALETLFDMDNTKDKTVLTELFGNSKDKNIIKDLESKENDEEDATSLMKKGEAFFTNATIDKVTAETIIQNHATKYLYKSVASTSIEDNGIAKEHSLRKIQTVIPITLHGEIIDIPDNLESDLTNALHLIKRMGAGRNRGLGRCDIKLETEA